MRGNVIGLVYDLFGSYPLAPDAPSDAEAEYEPEATLHALEAAIRRLGHEPLRLGNAHELLQSLGSGKLPPLAAALSIAEGYGSRNREGWAPALMEMAGVPQLGSDALSLGLCLDKAWAKQWLAAAGVPVSAQALAASRAEAETLSIPATYPLFVKPRWEGTAKGIHPGSKVEDRHALLREVERITQQYAQPALIEPFLPGAEYTLAVVGHAPPRALPVLQRALESSTGIGLHALERHAPAEGWKYTVPGSLDAALEARLSKLALQAFETLACRDFARVDFRLDADGEPFFLEINPLPSFAPNESFGVLAELAGQSHEELLAEILAQALARLGIR